MKLKCNGRVIGAPVYDFDLLERVYRRNKTLLYNIIKNQRSLKMKLKCILFGHDTVLAVHPLLDTAGSVHQIMCKRCSKSFGQRRHNDIEPKSKIEDWVRGTLPFRQKRRMIKQAKKMGWV